jgi:hypothetical protein
MRRDPNEVFSRYELVLADGRVKVVWYSHGANDAAVVLDGECVFLSYKVQEGGWTKTDFENAAKSN